MIKILLAVLLALVIMPVQAYTPAPANTIDNPRIVLHKKKHKVQIKWYQYVQSSPKLVIAFKVTNTRQSGATVCSDVDWAEFITRTEGFTYCYDLLAERMPESKWVTVTDKHWHKNDRYYIIQYDFTSHNAPYGPYIPR